jgi:hypothetical protein
VHIAVSAKADFIVFQEPPHAAASAQDPSALTHTTQLFKQQLNQACLHAGFTPYITRHTICLIATALHAKLHTQLPNLHQGRAQTFVFQLAPAKFLHITGLYNYQAGYSDRQQVYNLHKSLLSHLRKIREQFSHTHHTIVVGDINVSNLKQKFSPKRLNILKSLSQKHKLSSVIPAVLQLQPHEYITRISNDLRHMTSPDHILCDPITAGLCAQAAIDVNNVHTTVPTDHLLIKGTFHLHSDPSSSADQPHTIPQLHHNYKMVNQIKVIMDKTYKPPRSIHSQTDPSTTDPWFIAASTDMLPTEAATNEQQIDALRQAHVDNPTIHHSYSLARQAVVDLETLVNTATYELSQHTHYHMDTPPLIKRTKRMATLIENITTNISNGINDTLDIIGLATPKRQPNKPITTHTLHQQRTRKRCRANPTTQSPSSLISLSETARLLRQKINHLQTTLQTYVRHQHSSITALSPLKRTTTKKLTQPNLQATLCALTNTINKLINQLCTQQSQLTNDRLETQHTASKWKRLTTHPNAKPHHHGHPEHSHMIDDHTKHVISTIDPHHFALPEATGLKNTSILLTNVISSLSADTTHHCNALLRTVNHYASTMKSFLAQVTNRDYSDHLLHSIKLNQTGPACKAAHAKNKDNPAPETVFKKHIISGEPAIHIPATSIKKQLQATKHNHNEHMKNPVGTNLFFADRTSDEVGICGITLKPDRTFTKKHLNAYRGVPNTAPPLDKDTAAAIINAHNDMRPLFEPKQPKPGMQWPFTYPTSKGATYTYTFTQLEQDIAPVPDASRYQQSHINILARLHKDWATLYHKLVNLCLICRIIPKQTKIMARIPIPKPGSVDRRPISVMHAIEAHLSTIVAYHLDKSLENTKALPRYITAYRKNKSCVDITLSHAAAIEDVIQHQHTIIGQLDEDFEKYFDRITLEMQCVALKRHCCPDAGYIEFVADSFQDNAVDIITTIGHVHTTFPCGIKQGSTLSCILANLVAHMYTETWAIPANTDDPSNLHPYKFYQHNTQSPPTSHSITTPVPHMITSYCDDGTRTISVQDINTLHPLLQHYVHKTGQFTIVSRIGRNTSKSQIRIYNCPQGYKPPPILSTAWSFSHQTVITRELKTLTMAYPLLPKLTTHTQNKPHMHKSFGPTMNMNGTIDINSIKTFQKTTQRLNELRQTQTHPVAQASILQTLAASMTTYNVLCNKLTHLQLTKLDDIVTTIAQKTCQLTKSTPSSLFFLPHRSHLGYNFPSFLTNQIVSLTRELYVNLNSPPGYTPASHTTHLTARIRSSAEDPGNHHLNFTRDAILELGAYGIHLRPIFDPLHSSLLDMKGIDQSAIGHPTTIHRHRQRARSPFPQNPQEAVYTTYNHPYSQLLQTTLLPLYTHPAPTIITPSLLRTYLPKEQKLTSIPQLMRDLDVGIHNTIHSLNTQFYYNEWRNVKTQLNRHHNLRTAFR